MFDRTCAGSTRAVLLVGWLGAALTAAVAAPAAHVLAREPDQVPQLIAALALFAPGLVGFGVIVIMSRVMMVLGRLKIAAVAVAGSWLLVIAADAVLAELVPARLVVAALALGNTIGQLVVAVPLVLAARRIRGPEAVRGTGRAALAGGVAGVGRRGGGVAVSLALPASDKLLATGVAVLAAAVAALAFGLVAYLLNDGDLRAAVSWLRQVTGASLTRRLPQLPRPTRRRQSPGAPTASCSSPVTACPFPSRPLPWPSARASWAAGGQLRLGHGSPGPGRMLRNRAGLAVLRVQLADRGIGVAGQLAAGSLCAAAISTKTDSKKVTFTAAVAGFGGRRLRRAGIPR